MTITDITASLTGERSMADLRLFRWKDSQETSIMKLAIISGTGLMGSKRVTKLRERGHDAVAASPDTGVNTLTGERLTEVLQGASLIVDVSNSPSYEVPCSTVHATQLLESIKNIAAAATDGTTSRFAPAAVEATVNGSLKDASVDRLACLLRHWTWADEAKARFERELADGWEYDEDLVADHPFGAYYHWCALLCGFTEAALEHGLLSGLQLDALRPDLEASLPGLRACRRLLVVIPGSLEEHPRIVDLLRDDETVGRLRRVHYAFGEALREEQMSRELDLLLYEH